MKNGARSTRRNTATAPYTLLREMCDAILINHSIGLYNGAYKAVELAMKMKG